MIVTATSSLPRVYGRVYGNDAILSRLERLGRNARTFSNLVAVGFPQEQLSDARAWFAESAVTPVEHYAAHNMKRGFFEDESLLQVFCRYFECTDWKLEGSPWFFAQDDYDRFTQALLEPLEFQIARLNRGLDRGLWEPQFSQVPFALGVERCKAMFWASLGNHTFYWQPIRSYAHLRAETMFDYLRREVNQSGFKPGRFHYHWEESFKHRFQEALERFEKGLEGAWGLWQAQGEGEGRRKRQTHSRSTTQSLAPMALGQSLAVLGLEAGQVSLAKVRQAFRQRSKEAHPDQGGSPDAFRRLTEAKDHVEKWLKN